MHCRVEQDEASGKSSELTQGDGERGMPLTTCAKLLSSRDESIRALFSAPGEAVLWRGAVSSCGLIPGGGPAWTSLLARDAVLRVRMLGESRRIVFSEIARAPSCAGGQFKPMMGGGVYESS